MKKYLYAVCDTLSGFMIGMDVSASEPDRYIIEQNRINTMRPNEIAPTIVYKLVGTIDDETLDGELLKIPQTVGDLSDSLKKLEAYKHAREAAKPL